MDTQPPRWSATARRNAWILILAVLPLEWGILTSHGCRVLYGPHGFKALFVLYPAYIALITLGLGHFLVPLRKNLRRFCMVVLAISMLCAITAALTWPDKTGTYFQRIWWYPCVSLAYALK